jgi:hypothetical protein
MATTSVSIIQIRRGYSYDLGTLASGELFWAIDTQHIYSIRIHLG